MIDGDYQEDIDDILIFDVYQDVHVNDTLTFNVYPDDRSFDAHYDPMSYCYDHESSTKRIIKHLDLSFKKDGCIKQHCFEDPFDESYSSKYHRTFLHDLVMCQWIKTHWADWMDVQNSFCEYTTQQQI